MAIFSGHTAYLTQIESITPFKVVKKHFRTPLPVSAKSASSLKWIWIKSRSSLHCLPTNDYRRIFLSVWAEIFDRYFAVNDFLMTEWLHTTYLPRYKLLIQSQRDPFFDNKHANVCSFVRLFVGKKQQKLFHLKFGFDILWKKTVG